MSDALHVVCPHCLTINRIPRARLDEWPRCGQCRRPLFEGHPITLNNASFERHLAHNDIPLVVDFWAPWCGPCQAMAPAFEQAAARLEPRVRLAKVDTEAEQAIATRFGIRSIPTLVLFRGGQEVARQPGAMGADNILHWVEAHL